MRPIDADELLETLEKKTVIEFVTHKYYKEDVLRAIYNAPTIEKTTPTKLLELEELYGHDGAFMVEYNPCYLSRRPMWAFLYLLDANKAHLQFAAGFEKYARAQYGVTWRCWSARPTEQEMEEAEWHAAGGEG